MKAMQSLLRTFNILAIALLCTLHTRVSAEARPLDTTVNADGSVDKEKDYSKSYTLAAGDQVSIHNSFGKVDVHTWDKNEVKVDVHIKVTSTTEEEATYVLDRIHIEDSKDGSLVRYRTNLDLDDHDGRHHNRKFSIDYTVYLPSTQTLDLENSFGATTLPDYAGPLDVTSKFGSLDAGRLGSVKSLRVEFGKAKVASISGGEVVIKYSKADLLEVSGQIDADFQFCDVMDLGVVSGIKGLKIKNAYTQLHLKLATGIPAHFDISTHFGSLNNRSDYPIKEEEDQDGKHRDMFRKTYSGKSGDGTVDVILTDEFATVDIS